MSDCGKRIRINRIFHGPSRKALVVAFDHALVLGPIQGTVDPDVQLKRFAEYGADAVLLNLGILKQCVDSVLSARAPAIILRLDWTSLWTAKADSKLISQIIATPEQALHLGADAVLTYLFVGTGDAEFESREIARNAKIARECERIGMPLIVESLARGKLVENPVAPEWMKLHVRIVNELGADLIKTEYTGDPDSMRDVIGASLAPVLVLGGERRKSDSDALRVVHGAVESGAAGVFFGRNVFQAEDLAGFLKRARTILDGSEPRERAMAGASE